MNDYLLALVGVIYAYVGLSAFWAGHFATGLIWTGYAVAQIGLIWRME